MKEKKSIAWNETSPGRNFSLYAMTWLEIPFKGKNKSGIIYQILFPVTSCGCMKGIGMGGAPGSHFGHGCLLSFIEGDWILYYWEKIILVLFVIMYVTILVWGCGSWDFLMKIRTSMETFADVYIKFSIDKRWCERMVRSGFRSKNLLLLHEWNLWLSQLN